ncbi:aminoglycoside phosphotransferase family protein [Nonomuraea soli]|uniref:Ser/Thr protein kinase RdoA (MazF antagonist) n=1 Tax=Nonomuraea soli TaxID=1032476 RepID=A0A7W0CL27_9ACTN|nr:aminoglycoside phosphotransferase family protein [Nonomuraea soli]MBA2893115.1 Ser/Thr protein kinase RdoA (MazF antagonist) [Nonomuraea soli]
MSHPDEEFLRRQYGWSGALRVTRGPRGALGQIWRVETGDDVHALKEIYADPPGDGRIEAELDFTRRAERAGVRSPRSRPDLWGRHLVATPRGTWLRLYEWLELTRVDLAEAALPAELGALLARLHLAAPPARTELDGIVQHPWYHRVSPIPERWAQLCAVLSPPDQDELVLCHRDLHPENILRDERGGLVVVDWDNLGTATPSRELAAALFDWFCDGPEPDLGAMGHMYDSYVAEGGPGRIGGQEDFTMLVATRVNFLQLQLRKVEDPAHREWAEREIAESLRIMPAPRHFALVRDLLRSRPGPK